MKQNIYLFLIGIGFLCSQVHANYSTDLSYRFNFLPQQTLNMPDGVKLSVNYWQPIAKRAQERFPIVLELLPYRKDDSHYVADYSIGAYLSMHGIGYARVDLRGTGSSEGTLPDREYSDQELKDMPGIIAALTKLPWSNGRIGMQGISWSAFNAMMAAMQRPSALKGILIAHGSDDLYANDIHNIDGALHIDIFTTEIDTDNILPSAPLYRFDANYFTDRFNQKPWIFTYLHHQRDGKFWQDKRSLQTNFAAINIPVLAYASLLDGYRDYAIHMLQQMKTPLKVAIGPQNHDWPNGNPWPRYEWRADALRFWQQVLNNKETKILSEPKITVFMRDAVSPNVDLTETPGKYLLTDSLDHQVTMQTFLLQANGTLLQNTAKNMAKSKDKINSVQTLIYKASGGNGLLNWWGEATSDMRPADKHALIYDSPTLSDDFYMMGNPQIQLTVSANAPLADWVVRLEDVNPDGSVSFVTGALRNGAQRFSRTHPKAIVKNQFFTLDFPLHFTTWKYKRGHKIRLVVTNAQFPLSWPTPYLMTTQIKLGNDASKLQLPVLNIDHLATPILPALQKEIDAPSIADYKTQSLTPFAIRTDNKGNTFAEAKESYQIKIHDILYQSRYQVSYRVNDKEPANAGFIGEGEDKVTNIKTKRQIKVQSIINMRGDLRYFYVAVTHHIFENNKLLRTRVWQEKIKRDFQ